MISWSFFRAPVEPEPTAGSGIAGIKHIPESVWSFEQQVIPDDLFSDEIQIALSHAGTVFTGQFDEQGRTTAGPIRKGLILPRLLKIGGALV
jgi:hypothetical protein